MLSKFSVKKPYTVVVGIVLIVILGIVSFTKMTTDLLPSMELPYAIVITTYPGASPETVEEYVTKPIEESMATINNIKNVSSVSYENYSMVVLEFNGETNMDTASIDMRENLDTVTGYFDDAVGSPIIMKLNPDMIPVMVAAVDMEGADSVELTKYVRENVEPDLEGVEGVASVSTIGAIEESVHVIIRQDMVDDVNDSVKAALDKKFGDLEKELNSASSQIASGKSTLNSSMNEVNNQFYSGEIALLDKKAELNKTENELKQTLNELVSKESEIKASETQLNSNKTVLEDSINQLKQVETQYNTLLSQKNALESVVSGGNASEAEIIQYNTIVNTLAALNQNIMAMPSPDGNGNLTVEKIPEVSTYLQSNLNQVNDGLAQISNYWTNRKMIEDAIKALPDGNNVLNQYLNDLYTQHASVQSQMDIAGAKLDSSEDKVNEGKQELETAKDSAYKGADMEAILTVDTVTGILSAQNFSMPAGYVVEDGVNYLVRVGDKFEDTKDMSDFVLLDLGMDDVDPIKLSDVAEVATVNNADDVYTNLNGNPGIMFTVSKQTNYSTKEVADNINDEFESMMDENSSLRITNLMDQGVYIDLVVNSVLENLGLGAILAILILLLFLKDIKPTGIIACSIPVSVVFAIVLMYFSGVTLNVISLSGLALGVGMLVDNSIVVIENIYRLRNDGMSAKEAAIMGAKQMTGAITASTLTTVSVFFPIVFTTGITRQLFVDMALTIGYSLLASLIIALTFVPMMAASTLKTTKVKENKLFEKLKDIYASALKFSLKHRFIVLGLVIVALVLSTFAAVSKGSSLMPEMDSTQLSLTLTMPEGTTDLNDTREMSDEVVSRISEIDDVTTVGAMVGGTSIAGMSMSGTSDDVTTVSMYIICDEHKKMSNKEIADEIYEKTKDLNCEIVVSTSDMDMSALTGSGVSIVIKGNDIDTLKSTADEIAGKIEGVEGLANVSNGQEKTAPEYRIQVDKDAAAAYGLTVAQVFQKVYGELKDPSAATTLYTDTNDYSVYVETDEKQEVTIKDIKNMTIEGTVNQEKKEVKLSKIVDITENEGLSSIGRDNGSRYITVTADIADGYNVTLVSKDVEKILKDYEAPDGFTVSYDGENESIMETMEQVLLMLLLAIIFMYLIMVIQFQSLKLPFIIMFTVPLAFTGGFIGLLISGDDVSVIAMIGMVMLAGIIVNNGIVLVDSINQLREEGVSKYDAIILSGKNRLRPIIMTALTTILGLSTMAFGVGMGADMVRPMAVVTIGGLIYGTLLTLLVVPCIYDLFCKEKNLKKDEDFNELTEALDEE